MTIAAAFVVLAALGCGSETFVNGPGSSGDGGTTGDAGAADSATDAASLTDATTATDGAADGASPCPSGMVLVPGDGAKAGFCIDATEVTQAAYAQFLGAVPTAVPQRPSMCSFKTTHVPGEENGGSCDNNPFNPASRGNYPVSCVDWCDAWSYCNWAGKHLCGNVGGTAQSGVDVDSVQDEWWRACSKETGRLFPYGTTYVQASCATGAASLHPVGSVATCEGGVAGLFDMSGNVGEWTWFCDQGSPPTCATRGGDYGDNDAQSLSCRFNGGMELTTRIHQVGFRCCK